MPHHGSIPLSDGLNLGFQGYGCCMLVLMDADSFQLEIGGNKELQQFTLKKQSTTMKLHSLMMIGFLKSLKVK